MPSGSNRFRAYNAPGFGKREITEKRAQVLLFKEKSTVGSGMTSATRYTQEIAKLASLGHFKIKSLVFPTPGNKNVRDMYCV